MDRQGINIIVFFTVIGSVVSSVPITCQAQNYEQDYLLIKEEVTYTLTLSITSSLLEYYQEKSHQSTPPGFASYVTPYSLAPVAEDIKSIFPEDEAFVNAVLMIVHQIPYDVVNRSKYPVETIIDNVGDCDLFSYIAASLLKSQHMDVVLLYYQEENHMNVGVHLSNPPQNDRTSISFVDYEGKRYYIAECTGDNWRNGWRVGECPPELETARLTIITLENCEQGALGQVSSSFDSMEFSSISLTASTKLLLEGNLIELSGQVSVSNASGIVTLYQADLDKWLTLGTVDVDPNGQFTFFWNPRKWGQNRFRASWSGDAWYAGADSRVISIFVIPIIAVYLGAGLIFLSIIYSAISMRKHHGYSTRATSGEEGSIEMFYRFLLRNEMCLIRIY